MTICGGNVGYPTKNPPPLFLFLPHPPIEATHWPKPRLKRLITILYKAVYILTILTNLTGLFTIYLHTILYKLVYVLLSTLYKIV